MTAKKLKEKVQTFMSCKNIAVIGISGTNDHEAANYNFKRLSTLGYNVFPVNPNLHDFDSQKCYASVKEIDADVDGALVFTHPDITEKILAECCDRGVSNIWVHRSFGQGSCSASAAEFMKDKSEVNFIDGACPMMFHEKTDWVHRCFYHVLKFAGKLPA